MKKEDVIAKCVEIRVAAQNISQFIEATLENARSTRKEPGNLRFEIHQSREDETLFILLEAYLNDDAITAHKATDYFQKWRSIAEPLMTGARRTTNCKIVLSEL